MTAVALTWDLSNAAAAEQRHLLPGERVLQSDANVAFAYEAANEATRVSGTLICTNFQLLFVEAAAPHVSLFLLVLVVVVALPTSPLRWLTRALGQFVAAVIPLGTIHCVVKLGGQKRSGDVSKTHFFLLFFFFTFFFTGR